MSVQFEVLGLPPMKDGASSMWCHQPGIDRLIALRRAAQAAFAEAGAQPLDGPVRVTLEVRGVPALECRSGDLDNFITGVLDGLQAAAPGTPWPDHSSWTSVAAAIQPNTPVGLVDDAWVVEVVACKRRGVAGEEPMYTVTLEAAEGW